MAPLDPSDPQVWTELHRQWQDAHEACARWWTGVLAPLPGTVDAGAGAGAGSAFTQMQARYQPRFQALAAAVLALPGPGGTIPELVSPAPGDRRFASAAWREQPYFALLRQSYLLYAEYLREVAALAPLPPADRQRLEFATRQYLDAVCADQFPGDQSGRAGAGDRHRGRKRRPGSAQPRRRRAQGSHLDDRRKRICRRPQPRGDARAPSSSATN